MFGASAGLNKPLLRNDTIRRSISEGRKHSVENPNVITPIKTAPIIKNPLLRRIHGRLKCVLIKWIINRFSEKSKLYVKVQEMHFYENVC